MNYPLRLKYDDAIKLAEGNRDQLSHLGLLLYENDILVSSGNFA